MKKILTIMIVGALTYGSAIAYDPSRCTGSPIKACKPYILFDFESAQIKQSEKKYLDWACAKANVQNWRNIVIDGHTDMYGGENVVLELGTLRAQAVRDYLIKCGVDPKRMQIRSFNEYQMSTDTPTDQYNNRRAVIKYTVNYNETDWVEE